MNQEQARPTERMVWDWWPLTRLLIVLAVFVGYAHTRFGWAPDLATVATLPRRLFEVLSFFTLISFGLAHLYLLFLMLPLYAAVTLNDTYYDFSHRILVSAGIRPRKLLAGLSLCGEVALFGLSAAILRCLAQRI